MPSSRNTHARLVSALAGLDRFNICRRESIVVIEAVRRDWRDQKPKRGDPVCLTDSAPVAFNMVAVLLPSALSPSKI